MKHRSFAIIALFVAALGMTGVPAMAAKKTAADKTETQKTADQKEAQKESAAQPAPKSVDLNTATKEELMSLPGITAAYAAKIIEGRPYREKITLRRQNILPADVFYAVMDRITIDPNRLQKLLKSKEKAPAKKKQ